MGVPAFFRWLSKKYPSIVVHCREEKAKVIDGVKVPVDITQPNPNDFEFDNLYLDMNGIIHPCCHPENKAAPANEDEMMEAIFEYIDRLVAIVRPRKLLYMAIDGVAPRAKMNQQRSRRFRASKDSRESREELARIKDEMRMKGYNVPPDKPEVEHFDSNCITPGTEFMFHLAECLRYYVHVKMNSDPGWSQMMVLLSDANVPGEGEHKIMDFIRRQRAQPNHDPNTSHCLCGADADLIMLGLATHEPNFTIIREEFKPHQERPCEICGQIGHKMQECTGMAKVKQGEFDEPTKHVDSEQDFIFLRLNVLKEYLYRELTMPNLPFPQDVERAIDDWVMMCFFVGNDFLPHLPSLEIREGAIDRLIGLYKRIVYKTGGYLTDSGHVHLDRVQLMLTDLGGMEDEIFKRRREDDEGMRKRNAGYKKARRESNEPNPNTWIPNKEFSPVALGQNVLPTSVSSETIRTVRRDNLLAETAQPVKFQTNHDVASELRNMVKTNNQGSRNERRKFEDDSEETPDNVRLWEDGWKDRYYENKFGVTSDDSNFRFNVANEYILGICWVLKYYYQGCASWNWYFPYHYAPFASDFRDTGSLNINFPRNTKPFRPLEQLMSVFPAASKTFLPPSWQELMFRPGSDIIDFYPSDFKIDLNGKRYAWQGVALLPFVEESRLLKTLQDVYPDLTEEEQHRNSLGDDRLFIHKSHKSFTFLEAIYENGHDETKVHINASLTHGVGGLAWCDEHVVLLGGIVKSPLPRLEDFFQNQTICVKFLDPQYDPEFVFHAKLLSSAQIPAPVLKPEDFDRRYPGQSYRPQTGFRRDSGYSGFHNADSANRMLRGSLNSASHSQGAFPPRHHRPYERYPNAERFDRYPRPPSFHGQYPRSNYQHFNAPARGGYQQHRNQSRYDQGMRPRFEPPHQFPPRFHPPNTYQ